MKYILLIFYIPFSSGSGAAVGTADFATKGACEKAIERVYEHQPRFKADKWAFVCVPHREVN